MTTVYTGASMSIDGFIAGLEDSGFEHLFAWYNNGDVAVPTANPDIRLSMNEASAAHYQEILDATGAIVVGRHLFDMTNAWGERHPMGVPVVVLTHRVPEGWPREGADFHFVTEGIDQAVATAVASPRCAVVKSASSCIRSGCVLGGRDRLG